MATRVYSPILVNAVSKTSPCHNSSKVTHLHNGRIAYTDSQKEPKCKLSELLSSTHIAMCRIRMQKNQWCFYSPVKTK